MNLVLRNKMFGIYKSYHKYFHSDDGLEYSSMSWSAQSPLGDLKWLQ